MINRLMRLLIMFDLPVDTKHSKREYATFRKFLLKDGYDMIQFSVYSRICANSDAAETHLQRARQMAPRKGAVRSLLITNKQFAEAVILNGRKKYQEKKVNENQLLFL
jgi:CRISPR-associated protein Cas2